MSRDDRRDAVTDEWPASRRGDGQQPSRREFLASMAAVGLATAGVNGSPQSRGAANRANPQLIDVHHHVFPPDFVEATLHTYIPQNRTVVSGWTVQQTLAQMDSNGVATAIVSMTSPGTWLGDVQRSRGLTRTCNEYSAQLMRDYPRRFGVFAALALPDTEGSLREIAYALDVLKADGVSLMTSYDGKYLGDQAFAPTFDELNRRRAIVHVHPTSQNASMTIVSGVPGAWAELPQETTRTVLSLLVSGSFGTWRNIGFIFSHAGGAIPMLAGRVSLAARFVDGLATKVPNGIEYELKRLHYDVAGAADRSAMAALMNLVPASQIMFGSDDPFLPIDATARGIGNVGLSGTELRAIGRENATVLFPRLKA